MSLITIKDIVDIGKHVRAWLTFLRKRQVEGRKEYCAALSTLYVAANETANYLAGLRRTRRRGLKKERELTGLWTNAGITLQSLDKDLAIRCLRKGQYWADPDSWTDADVKRARIDLVRVQRDARLLLVRTEAP